MRKSSVRVLVVDDEPALGQALKELLQAEAATRWTSRPTARRRSSGSPSIRPTSWSPTSTCRG